MEAWYFSNASKTLRYNDGRAIALGVTHTVEGDIALCERGLHASAKPLDALSYAPGLIIWRVRLGETILTGDDKLCASERTYVAGGVNAEETLRLFARQCALDVAHLWDMPAIVRQYLETGDENIRAAAYDAAYDAARAAQNARLDAMLTKLVAA